MKSDFLTQHEAFANVPSVKRFACVAVFYMHGLGFHFGFVIKIIDYIEVVARFTQ